MIASTVRTIEVSDETYAALEAAVAGFDETPESVIRRLLPPASRLGASWFADNDPTSSALQRRINSQDFLGKTAKEKYLALLEFLHQEKPQEFAALVHMKFGKRVQIATSPHQIVNSGRSTKPEKVGATGFWALTNLSNRSKRDVIARAMQKLGYANADQRLAVSSIPDTHPSPSAARLLEGLI